MCGFRVKWWSIEGEKKKGFDLKHVFDSPRRPSLVATKLLLFASLSQPKANLASFKPLSLLPGTNHANLQWTQQHGRVPEHSTTITIARTGRAARHH